LRAKVDAILPHLAPKADLHAMETRLIKWIVGALFSGIALAVAIAQAISHFLK